MKFDCKTSLRKKVHKIIVIFSAVVIIFYTWGMEVLLHWGLENGATGIIWQENSLYKEAYKEDRNAPLPKGRTVNGYLGIDNVPEKLITLYSKSKLTQSINDKEIYLYRKEIVGDYVTHHNLVMDKLPDRDEYTYIHYELKVYKYAGTVIWGKWLKIAFVGGLLVIVMLLILQETINHSIRPLKSLSQWVEGISENRKPESLPADLNDDEIGQLAHSLYAALERIYVSNEREKQFLRNASHELRTPIAIIRNSMDVIEFKRENSDDEITPLLKRIRRASDTMKAVTEAILWLALENYSQPCKSQVNLKELINEIVDDNKNLINDRNIDIDIQTDQLGDIFIEKALIYITLDNLIRNAFQHSSDGTIKVSAESSHAIEVFNYRQDTESMNDESNEVHVKTGGFGLGLAMVEKIAKKMGWGFTFKADQGQAIARLDI